MEDLHVLDLINIQSFRGQYSVSFIDDLIENCSFVVNDHSHYLVDANIARLYSTKLKKILNLQNTIIIEATEENKSIEQIIPVINKLVKNNIRRDQVIIGIGGGIIQDITCFIASTLMRGVAWKFIPTTLLAQADSCIGSKSSINLGKTKNILGTFNPPDEIFICTSFLDTLEEKEIDSGIGEIIKVHAIDSADSYDKISKDYELIISNRKVLLKYIRNSLLIKQRYIEIDEFDKGTRNIFNYGHSFGHAIESATNFGVPHGIAVTIGMDMAIYIAHKYRFISEESFKRMQPVLKENNKKYLPIDVPTQLMKVALKKDKKNTAEKLVLILPVGRNCNIERVEIIPDDIFWNHCKEYLRGIKG